MATRQGNAQRLRPYDVLQALNALAQTWPDVIVPEQGVRRFRKSAARAVLMALHRCYHWETFAIALPVKWSNRGRPAEDVDIARETGLGRTTVGAVMRWLTDEQKILVTAKDHGWTGPRVRRFNVELINQLLGGAEPESVAATDSRSPEPERPATVPSHIEGRPEPERPAPSSERPAAGRLGPRNQESVKNGHVGEQGATPGDVATLVEFPGNRTDGPTPAPKEATPAAVDDETWEAVLRLVPHGRGIHGVPRLLRQPHLRRWVEGRSLVLAFQYGAHRGEVERELPALREAVMQVLGLSDVVMLDKRAAAS